MCIISIIKQTLEEAIKIARDYENSMFGKITFYNDTPFSRKNRSIEYTPEPMELDFTQKKNNLL